MIRLNHKRQNVRLLALYSALFVVLQLGQLHVHINLFASTPSLRSPLSSVLDAYGQSFEALPSQLVASGSESHVPGVVSE
ncbi:hypothetical protein Tco_0378617 [Tanacetum coccineum]